MWCTHRNVFLLLLLISNLLGSISCSNDNLQKKVSTKKLNSTNLTNDTIKFDIVQIKIDTLEQKLMDANLVDIQTVDSSILIDLKYSTINNFMKEDVYGALNKVYLQKSVAQDLKEANQFLHQLDSTLTLLVYDGVRPRSVQQKMWDVLDLPINEKTKFVSNPKNGSIHNFGCAVDLTIAHINGTPLDMGADFDEIGKIAYPRLEKQFLKSGELTIQQIENRELLRKVMQHAGFYNIQTEWWHFNRYNRNKAKQMFEIIE
ncbi:MAG TPA: peptidase M15 [Crocinitomix sp.]|nr:peptidase M15 [Crocinitomix sp.]